MIFYHDNDLSLVLFGKWLPGNGRLPVVGTVRRLYEGEA